jgi:phthalate 4,5-cis-dihydrodiol dehydrogenase
VSIAALAGKHILVEKPMALSLEECDAMIQAAASAGVVLMVGHTNGYDAPVLAMRDLTLSQRFGRLRMLNAMHFSDFIYRPRRPEELDTDLGGGIMFNQFPHQVEMIRTISDAAVTKVSATCGVWDAERPTEGAVTALLHLEGDCVASIVYNGYAHLDSAGFYTGLDSLAAGLAPFSSRHAIAGLTKTEEAEAKSRSGYLDQRSRLVHPAKPDSKHERFGLVIASYEHADVVPTPSGLAAYTDDGIELISVPFGTGSLSRSTVMDEVAAAIAGVPPLHDGLWGRTTLEICLAALNSSRNDGAFRQLSKL